jgi:NADPH-dependent ferric siderophore reductase
MEIAMSPVPELLANTLGKILFRTAMVSDVKDLSGHFRLVEVVGETLREEAWIPGQKVQFHMGNLVARTYTPTAWDSVNGRAQFLTFLHGNGPGSEWAASIKKGDPCQFIGPRSSLNFAEIREPIVFFGDETSIGAAQALYSCNGQSRANCYVFEVSSLVETQEVMQRVGLMDAQLIQRMPGDAHLQEAEQFVSSSASRLGLPQCVLTGKAQSIQMLRKFLKARRVLFSKLETKAYWAHGKTGLD